MMLSAFTACGNVGGISDYPAELEEAGISQKDFEAMSDEQKQAILDELGIKAEIGTDKEDPKPTEKPKDAKPGINWQPTVALYGCEMTQPITAYGCPSVDQTLYTANTTDNDIIDNKTQLT